MATNKFMVIRFKELLKTGIFAVLGVIIIVVVIHFVQGKIGDATSLYIPGEYSSEIELENGTIAVKVTVDRKRIVAVNIVDRNEAVPVFYPLFAAVGEQVAEKIVREQTTQIDIEGGNDVTASMIIEAVDNGLKQALK